MFAELNWQEGTTRMKAAVYYENGGPDVFRYEDVPDPECHHKGIVIRVEDSRTFGISIESELPPGHWHTWPPKR